MNLDGPSKSRSGRRPVPPGLLIEAGADVCAPATLASGERAVGAYLCTPSLATRLARKDAIALCRTGKGGWRHRQPA